MFSNDAYVYMDESQIHPLLKCKLCTKPFIDPVATPNGDRSCRQCITRILNRDLVNDRSSITSTNENTQASRWQRLASINEPLILDMLDAIPVQCTDCGEINIPRGKFNEHRDNQCPKAIALCPASNVKCLWAGTREILREHIKECKLEPLRPVLEDIFHTHEELNTRIHDLEGQIHQYMGSQGLDILSIE